MIIVDLKQKPEYLETLAKWHQDEWCALNPGQSLEARIHKMQSFLGTDFIPSTWLALEAQTAVGSAAVVEQDMDTRPELGPWMASLYVVRDFRGKGIGSKLVRHVMREAHAHGLHSLYLFTPDAESFYTPLGWNTLEHTEYRGHGVTIMSASLNKGS